MSNPETTISQCPPPPPPAPETRQDAIHRRVRETLPQLPEHEFFLVTDGSGFTDGFAGAACLSFSPKHKFFDLRLAAFSGSDTERAEFEALMMGLQAIMDHMEWASGEGLQLVRKVRPMVHWLSDREALVLSATTNPDTGTTYFQRRSTPDLWARFEFYETCFRITPQYASRNLNMLQRVVDVQSSTMRELMKQYITDEARNLSWMDGWETAWRCPAQFLECITKLREAIAVSTPENREAHLESTMADAIVRYGKDFVTAARAVASSDNAIKTLSGFFLPHI